VICSEHRENKLLVLHLDIAGVLAGVLTGWAMVAILCVTTSVIQAQWSQWQPRELTDSWGIFRRHKIQPADPNQAIDQITCGIFVTPAADFMTISKKHAGGVKKQLRRNLKNVAAWSIDSACTNRELDCCKHQERKSRKASEKIQIFRFKRVQTFERMFVME